jgi:hypothetical protein
MPYEFLANLVLLVHFALVLFAVLGFLFIWVGFFLRWAWVRNPVFRTLHLLFVGVVLLQALDNRICPLTTWENELRLRAGQDIRYQQSFIEYWIHRLMFYDFAPATFQIGYAAFFLLLVLSLAIVRPHRGGR